MTSPTPASIDVRSLRASILWLVSSTGVGHVLSFVSAPLLIALYAPESFGAFALLSVAATMIGNISATRYERAIVLAACDDDARLMLRACLAMNVLAGAAVLLGFVVCSNYFDRLAGLSQTQIFMAASLTAVFGVNQTLTHWLTRCGKFSRVALADLCLTLVTLALQMFLGLIGRASAESLLGGMLIGRIASIVVMVHAAGPLALTSPRSYADVGRLFVQYRTLALYSTPNAVVAALQFRALLFLVAHFNGLADAGRLAIAYRLTYVPATAFGTALRRVFFPTFSRALADRNTNELALAMLTFLGIVVPPGIIGCSLLLFSAAGLLPAEWQASVSYIQCLLPIAAILVFTSWFDQVYDVLHRQRSALILESAASLIAVGLFCASAAAGATAVTALAAYAFWIFVYNIAWLAFTWQLTAWPQSHFVRALAAGSAYSLLLCIAYPLRQVSLALAIALLVGGALTAWHKFSVVTLWLGKDDDLAYQKVA